jgi:peptidoglycan hydrolase-like protein with peptidoglycan-binding domain
VPTDTFTATNGSDGSGSLSGATYPTLASFATNDGNGTIYANRGFNGAGTYFVDNALMYFDTSGLPDDATVTGAELEVVVIVVEDTDNLSVIGEYFAYDGSPTVAGDITLDEVGGAFAAVDITSIGTGAEIFTLTNVSNISKTGNTGFRLKCTKRAADAAPTGFNYIGMAEADHATLAPPTLRVTYTTGAAPTYFQLHGIA